MPVTFRQAVIICLTAALFSAAIAPGQPAQRRNPPCQSQPTTLPAQRPLAPDRLFALASPAVVKLTIKDEDGREIGIASGFIVRVEKRESDQDLCRTTIVTNCRVIRPAISIDVSFSDVHGGSAWQVIGEDDCADLAVLTVFSCVEPKRTLKLQESASPPIGTRVYAIGSSRWSGNTLSEGLISGYRQRDKREPWIQTTAPTGPGFSGGPLLSSEGSVLGVMTALPSESRNLNFAVPASEVSRLLNQAETPRQVWQGASIRETERDAFQHTELCFIPLWLRDGRAEQTFTEFLEEQVSAGVRAGDQLALLLKGRDLYSRKEHDEAIAVLRRAAKAEPGEYAYLAHYALGQAIRANVKHQVDFESAVEHLRQAKELNPDFGPTFYELCCTYMALRRFPELLVEAESLIRLMPRCYDGYRLRGEAWAELGRVEEFERDFEMACDLRPHDYWLLFAKAGGYLSMGKLQKAVDTYKDVIELNADSWAAHNNLGDALRGLGEYDEAITSYQKALRLAGGDTHFERMIEDSIAECRCHMTQSP